MIKSYTNHEADDNRPRRFVKNYLPVTVLSGVLGLEAFLHPVAGKEKPEG